MVNKFIIFCETTSETGKSVRFVNDIFCGSDELQERLVSLHSIGVNVFKVLPILLDEQNGLINFEYCI